MIASNGERPLDSSSDQQNSTASEIDSNAFVYQQKIKKRKRKKKMQYSPSYLKKIAAQEKCTRQISLATRSKEIIPRHIPSSKKPKLWPWKYPHQ